MVKWDASETGNDLCLAMHRHTDAAVLTLATRESSSAVDLVVSGRLTKTLGYMRGEVGRTLTLDGVDVWRCWLDASDLSAVCIREEWAPW